MSKIVFKQWIYAPNRNGTSHIVSNMVQYIATRPGVELGSMSLESELEAMRNSERSKELYAQYIATRPGVDKGDFEHGLFGKILDMKDMDDITDLQLACGHIENLAHDKKTIYNAVISLKGDDALNKDLVSRSDWAAFVDGKINDIAREMDINPRTMEWVAAVHMEKKHPHLHIMYWDTEQKIGVNYIDPKKSDIIRKGMIKELFDDEFKEIMQQKDSIRKDIIDRIYKADDSILRTEASGFSSEDIYNLAKGMRANGDVLDRRTAHSNCPELTTKLLELRELMRRTYQKGAFKYQLLPPELKKQVDEITTSIIKDNPDIAAKYSEYIDTVKNQAGIYGGKDNIAHYSAKARIDLYKEIGNKVLSSIKELNKAQYAAYLEHRDEPSKNIIERQQHYQNIVSMNLMQSVLNIISDNEQHAKFGGKMTGRDLSKAEKKELAKDKSDQSIDWG